MGEGLRADAAVGWLGMNEKSLIRDQTHQRGFNREAHEEKKEEGNTKCNFKPGT